METQKEITPKGQHTQGEWVINHGASYIPTIGSRELHQPIATLHRMDSDSKKLCIEAEANAKIIAAAPDMLEALKILLEEAERVAMLVDSKYWDEAFREKWNKNTNLAEMAIDKATK